MCGLVIVLLVSLDFPRFGLAVLTWLPAISWLGVMLGLTEVLILQRRQDHQVAQYAGTRGGHSTNAAERDEASCVGRGTASGPLSL